MDHELLVFPQLNITVENICGRFAEAVADGDWDEALRCIVDAVEFRDCTCKPVG